MVLVEDVASYYQRFADGLRVTYRRVPTQGFPRLTRLRPGQTQFKVFDPTGNMLVFIDKNQPQPDVWGAGEDTLELIQALENALFLRDTYANDEATAKVLDKALSRNVSAEPVELARALAARAELAVALGDPARAQSLQLDLQELSLLPEEYDRFHAELSAAADLERWLTTPQRS